MCSHELQKSKLPIKYFLFKNNIKQHEMKYNKNNENKIKREIMNVK